eukprot:gene48520-biopygen94089
MRAHARGRRGRAAAAAARITGAAAAGRSGRFLCVRARTGRQRRRRRGRRGATARRRSRRCGRPLRVGRRTERRRWGGQRRPRHPLSKSSLDSLLYVLVDGELPNGHPLWKQVAADRWLYSGTDGRWYVGDTEEKEKGFKCVIGFVFCPTLHGGRSPPEMTGWQQWDETSEEFVDGCDITVTAAGPGIEGTTCMGYVQFPEWLNSECQKVSQ